MLCADSQETVGDYRVSVDKIRPQDVGDYDLVIGGAGDGDLIDGFSETVARLLRGASEPGPEPEPQLSEDRLRDSIHLASLDFHQWEVALSASQDKRLHFVVCVRRKSDGAVYLWDLRGTTITDITDYSLVGWDEAIYKHEVRKFYRPQLSLAQTVVLGIDLLTLAKSTSNYVGGDTQVIVARKNGIWIDLPEDVRKLEEGIARFNEELGRIALACLDVSIPDREFAVMFKRFEKQINLLRRTYAEAAVIGHTIRQVRTRSQDEKEAWQGFPYPKYSFDALVDLLYGRERIQRAITEAKEAEAMNPKEETKRSETAPGWMERTVFGPVPTTYHYKDPNYVENQDDKDDE